MPHRTRPRAAFTLIELSIVLVIIGLLVGGVLVGRDLIRAAELRAVLTEREQMETAVLTYRLKYNCLPGDCPRATAFGLGPNGNGDARIFTNPEMFRAVQHLVAARLLSRVTNPGDTTTQPQFNGTPVIVPGSTPPPPATRVPGMPFSLLPTMRWRGTAPLAVRRPSLERAFPRPSV